MSTSWWLWQALLPPTASSLAGLWPLHAEHTVLKSKDLGRGRPGSRCVCNVTFGSVSHPQEARVSGLRELRGH
eukprot:s462_g40.t1